VHVHFTAEISKNYNAQITGLIRDTSVGQREPLLHNNSDGSNCEITLGIRHLNRPTSANVDEISTDSSTNICSSLARANAKIYSGECVTITEYVKAIVEYLSEVR
jgi:hypothetical protein